MKLAVVFSFVILTGLLTQAYPAEYPIPLFKCETSESYDQGNIIGLSLIGPGLYEATVYDIDNRTGSKVLMRIYSDVKKEGEIYRSVSLFDGINPNFELLVIRKTRRGFSADFTAIFEDSSARIDTATCIPASQAD